MARERLNLILDKLLGYSLVWVTAPAGYGKTVFAANYLASREYDTLWYRLDQRDSELATFFHYFREAAVRAGISAANQLPPLTGEYKGGETAYSQNFFEKLFSGAAKGFVIVLDDFQEIAESAPLHQLLPAVVQSVPPESTLVVLSRYRSPPNVARFLVHRTMGMIDETELRFSPHEIEALAQSASIDVDSFIKQSFQFEGWAAGLTLAVERLRRSDESDPTIFDRDAQMFNYFAQELFYKLPPSTRDFLLSSVVVPQFDWELAQLLSGQTNAEEILGDLMARNYFIYRQGLNYRYHHLFREFLFSILSREWEDERLQQLRLNAAELLIERADTELALPLLREAGSWERYIQVLLQVAPAIMAQGRYSDLLVAIDAIPAAIQEQQPWLTFWRATGLLPTDYNASFRLYDKTYRLFEAAKDEQGLLLAWSGAVDAIIFSLSDVARLDVWLQRFEVLLQRHAIDPDGELASLVASRVMTILTLRQPDHPEFDFWRQKAERAVSECNDINQRVLSGFYLVTHSIWGGRLGEAANLIENCMAASDEEQLPPLAAVTFRLAQAWLGWTSGDQGECDRSFQQGIELAQDSGVHVWTRVLWLQSVTNALIHGDIVTAEANLAKIESASPRAQDMDRAYYLIDRAWLELSRNELARAREYQQLALRAAEDFGAVYTLAEAHFGMAQVCYQLGEKMNAYRHLTQAKDHGRHFGSWTMHMQCGFTEAWFALEESNPERATSLLSQILPEALKMGLVAFNGWRPEVMAKLFAHALRHRLEVELVTSLIHRFQLLPPAELSISEWPWPLRIATFGQFRLEVAGTDIDLSGSKHRRPCDLLKLLLTAGAQGITENSLAEIMWPDLDGDLGMRNLRTNLHRLRRLVGKEIVKSVPGGRLIVDARYCYCDAWIAIKLLNQIRAIADEELPASVRYLCTIDPGEFLAGEENYLAAQLRESMYRKMLDGSTAVLARLQVNAEHDIVADYSSHLSGLRR